MKSSFVSVSVEGEELNYPTPGYISRSAPARTFLSIWFSSQIDLFEVQYEAIGYPNSIKKLIEMEFTDLDKEFEFDGMKFKLSSVTPYSYHTSDEMAKKLSVLWDSLTCVKTEIGKE
jgi:hypothetical protein